MRLCFYCEFCLQATCGCIERTAPSSTTKMQAGTIIATSCFTSSPSGPSRPGMSKYMEPFRVESAQNVYMFLIGAFPKKVHSESNQIVHSLHFFVHLFKCSQRFQSSDITFQSSRVTFSKVGYNVFKVRI